MVSMNAYWDKIPTFFVWIISVRPVGPSIWWNEEVIFTELQNLMFDLVFDHPLYSIGNSGISPMFGHPCCQARSMGLFILGMFKISTHCHSGIWPRGWVIWGHHRHPLVAHRDVFLDVVGFHFLINERRMANMGTKLPSGNLLQFAIENCHL